MDTNIQFFEDTIMQIDGAQLSQFFGKPCGKINKKAFCAYFEDEMVFKVGKERVDELVQIYVGAKNFDPSGKGRAMKDWIQVPYIYKDEWEALAKESIFYLEGL